MVSISRYQILAWLRATSIQRIERNCFPSQRGKPRRGHLALGADCLLSLVSRLKLASCILAVQTSLAAADSTVIGATEHATAFAEDPSL